MAAPAVSYKADGTDPEVKVNSPAKNRSSGQSMGSERRSSGFLPILFERASSKWWDPQFAYPDLEKKYWSDYLPSTLKRFRSALIYIMVACVAWMVFFALMKEENWIPFLAGTAVIMVTAGIALIITFLEIYKRIYYWISSGMVIMISGFLLANFYFDSSEISAVGTFICGVEVMLMIYTVVPLPLYLSVIFGVLYSLTFEILCATLIDMQVTSFIIGRALMQLAIHLIGIHTFILSQSRKRGTFFKVAHSVLDQEILANEKLNTKNMINSLMPSKVAEEVLAAQKGRESEDIVPDAAGEGKLENPERIKFRSFHMSQMDDVSILFADIVGFTKMSSNKTAEHLVGLLSDLFGRFDKLCEESGCEKISTLGDCYYCVSGCPDPKPNHAHCCIDMGMGMVEKIEEFDKENNEEVGMRVGVHTGTVLCGLVGTVRFKFDVWSNDVTLANTMESEGKAGEVHISQTTYECVKDDYEVEQGEPVADIRKHKVLIEDYNKDTSKFQIRHIQDQDTINTYFVKRKLPDKSKPQKDEDILLVEGEAANGLSAGGTKELESGEKETKINMDESDQAGNKTENSSTVADSKAASPKEALLPVAPSDKELVTCMVDNKAAQHYLNEPEINFCTLNFLAEDDEESYRKHYQEKGSLVKKESCVNAPLSSPQTSAVLDILISMFFFILISAACFLGFPVRIPWCVVFVLGLIIQLVLLVPSILVGFRKNDSFKGIVGHLKNLSGWLPRHLFGALFTSLPVLAVYANFSCATFDDVHHSDLYYCLLVVVSLLHFCNFTMLSSWMKTCLATLGGIILLILIEVRVCSYRRNNINPLPEASNMTTARSVVTVAYAIGQQITSNFTVETNKSSADMSTSGIFIEDHPPHYEIILNIALLIFLIWFLNREFEITYRVSLYRDIKAIRDKAKIAGEKKQAEWLLHNIIPEHVSHILKRTQKYCKNHKDVGVIFAKIVNFDDFYDESFEGGKEYLRVLNELMGDFEDLFNEEKYKDIEKIKTIGACLMAASGLNPKREDNADPNAHLYALMEFSQELLKKLENFNDEIFNFNFEMSIGYNFGEVTAGVIGTTKLLYDIWGDTVNIASRMYSTGQSGRIQVTEITAKKLEEKFDFEYRGEVFVKGKGDMKTYLLMDKKKDAKWN